MGGPEHSVEMHEDSSVVMNDRDDSSGLKIVHRQSPGHVNKLFFASGPASINGLGEQNTNKV